MNRTKWVWLVILLVVFLILCLLGFLAAGIFYYLVQSNSALAEVNFSNLEDGQTLKVKEDFPYEYKVKLGVENDENLNKIYFLVNDEVIKILKGSPYEFTWLINKEGKYRLKIEAYSYNSSDKNVETITVLVKQEKISSKSPPKKEKDITKTEEGKTEKEPVVIPKGYPSPIIAVKAQVGDGYVFKEVSNDGSKAEVWYGPPESEFFNGAICKKLDDGSWVVTDNFVIGD